MAENNNLYGLTAFSDGPLGSHLALLPRGLVAKDAQLIMEFTADASSPCCTVRPNGIDDERIKNWMKDCLECHPNTCKVDMNLEFHDLKVIDCIAMPKR
jgi:hypothetical protein